MPTPSQGTHTGAIAVAVNQEIDVVRFAATSAIDGQLSTAIQLGPYTRVDLDTIKWQPAVGVCTTRVQLKGIPSVANRAWPGYLLEWLEDWNDNEFLIQSSPPRVGICQQGVLVHHEGQSYIRKNRLDVAGAYTFYPYTNGEPPFENMDEVWTIDVKMEKLNPDRLTITVSGDLHPGISHVAGPIDDATDFNTIWVGHTWEQRPRIEERILLCDFPINAQILGGRLILEESVGAVPVITAFTATDECSTQAARIEVGCKGVEALTMTATVAGPQTITGYYVSFDDRTPLPLPGVFNTPVININYTLMPNPDHGQHPDQFPEGVWPMYCWAVSDGLKVSAAATANVKFCYIRLDGIVPELYPDQAPPPWHYRIGETAIVEGGVLSLDTLYPGDDITYTIPPSADDGIFEIVNGVLKFKVAPTGPPSENQSYYVVYVKAENEHGLYGCTRFIIYGAV